ncbi:Extracellular protein [Fragilaria crotonensis]|nr:Extracellular protein [Fragilaria crotonensis]
MQAALDRHNALRAHHGAPPLAWSDDCARNAQKAANYCQSVGHLEHSNHPNQGQNLYSSSNRANPVDATQRWYNEVASYDYNNPRFSMSTGHFTQLVWKSTTHVGIAVSPDGKYLAANYSPSGNVTGRFRENVLPPHSRRAASNTMHVPTNQDMVLINPQSGKALDVANSGTDNGTNIHLWERNGGGAQMWRYTTDQELINPQSGKALDVSSSGTDNGTNIHLWERHGGGNQKWVFMADGSIVNPQSGKALDVANGGTDNGTNIHLWERNGSGAQNWQFVAS